MDTGKNMALQTATKPLQIPTLLGLLLSCLCDGTTSTRSPRNTQNDRIQTLFMLYPVYFENLLLIR